MVNNYGSHICDKVCQGVCDEISACRADKTLAALISPISAPFLHYVLCTLPALCPALCLMPFPCYALHPSCTMSCAMPCTLPALCPAPFLQCSHALLAVLLSPSCTPLTCTFCAMHCTPPFPSCAIARLLCTCSALWLALYCTLLFHSLCMSYSSLGT